MKAAVLFELGKKLNVIDGIEIPELSVGQVLVRVAFSGVCHSQLMEVRGGRGEDKWLPHLLGHEATGVVDDIGPEVTKVKKGDRVILGWLKGSGQNAQGAKYKWQGQILNSGAVTTFSTHTVVSENRCYHLPKNIPLDIGVLFGCAIPTGAGIILNDLQPKSGSSVGVVGLGGIGLSALMACSSKDVGALVAIDVSPSKLELAKSLGATHCIDASHGDVKDTVLEITGGKGLDYCVEAAGLISTIELGFSLIKTGGGRLVFASHPPSGSKISIEPHELISGKEIRGSWGGASEPERDIPVFNKLYQTGALNLNKMVDKRYSLEQINEALDDLEQKTVIRPIIEIHPDL